MRDQSYLLIEPGCKPVFWIHDLYYSHYSMQKEMEINCDNKWKEDTDLPNLILSMNESWLWNKKEVVITLLLLLLSCFSHVWLCATPKTAAHQVPPSLGFSRQEHWSGLPFPSPMQESEKWKVKMKSLSPVRLVETPWTAVYQAPPSMGFSRQEYWSGVPSPSPGPDIRIQ